jgi:hypothetical protein
MELSRIISATLGLSPPWQINRIAIADDSRRLDISISYNAGNQTVCPRCGATEACCGSQPETWYHCDFFNYATYLHTSVPQLSCCGQRHTVERPWARSGSKFVKIG